MPLTRCLVLLLLSAMLVLAAPAAAQDSNTGNTISGAQTLAPPPPPPPPAPVGPFSSAAPPATTTYSYGPDGRYLLDGVWLFRFDRGQGLKRHFQNSGSRAGWTTVNVPNAWNATDDSAASFVGTVAWYRRDFRLPSASAAPTWIIHFDSVNYVARVWLNGHEIGSHEGASQPWEIALAGKYLHRGGLNRLVMRVDDRRKPSSLPPGGNGANGRLVGGWWNYGGLLRDVYLRRVNRIDFQNVQVIPDLPCPGCAGQVRYRVTLHNYANHAQRVGLTSTFGSQALSLGTATIRKGATHTYTRVLSVPNPRVWSPSTPNLYDVNLYAAAGSTRVAHWFLRSGIRSVRVINGQLLLNGQVLNFRGVGLHQDSPQYGFAVSNQIQDREIAEVKDLGVTVVRSHYPLSEYFAEQADANGIMLWSEVPVYSVQEAYLESRSVRRAALSRLSTNVLTNSSHPSVIVWSIGNELSSKPKSGQIAYIREAVHTAHALDPTRPVGLPVAAYLSSGCQAAAYRSLQIIGLNDYFGWYVGPGGEIADRDVFSGYLDQMHSCYGDKAVVVTEYGAEANRAGPVDEHGTFAFQQDFINFHVNLFNSKPWLGGAIYWGLEEFRVRPGWDGGDPKPQPPLHNKGLITFVGQKKPGYFTLQSLIKATPQLRPR